MNRIGNATSKSNNGTKNSLERKRFDMATTNNGFGTSSKVITTLNLTVQWRKVYEGTFPHAM